MADAPDGGRIETSRLDLVILTSSVAEAIVGGDIDAASRELGATAGRWLGRDPSHVVQLHLAAASADAAGFRGFARLIIPRRRASGRRIIGSIGFHGPPDAAGRLEVGCRIHPAHHGRGYGAEATTGLLEWATTRFGVTRFLLAIPPPYSMSDLVPIEIEPRRAMWSAEIEALASLIEGARAPGR